MDRYYVTRAPSPLGLHEVHRKECRHLPPEPDRVFLGLSSNSNEAVSKARNLLRAVCPCECCLPLADLVPGSGRESVDKGSKSMGRIVAQ